MKLKKVAFAAAAMLAGLTALPAQASLIPSAPETFSGTGLGAVNTILTIRSPDNSTFESGSVIVGPGNTEVIAGDTQNQTQLRTLGQLGVTSAESLRVVFNASENQNDPGITLRTLELSIYNAAGTEVFDAPLLNNVPFTTPITFPGTGNSGFVFRLDPGETAELQGVLNANLGTFSTFRVGLAASAGCTGTGDPAGCLNATGGLETFFVANSPTAVTPIPEPETYALMMAGLGAIGFMARRRRQKQS